VANTFFWAGEIEAWGRGTQRVFDSCREAGTPEPRIQVEPGELWFEFPFSPAYLDSVFSGKTTQETTQEQILTSLREEPTITRKALADRIGITPDGIKYHLAKLRKARTQKRVVELFLNSLGNSYLGQDWRRDRIA
jgi:ATP-dependent DNA helicase RecG